MTKFSLTLIPFEPNVIVMGETSTLKKLKYLKICRFIGVSLLYSDRETKNTIYFTKVPQDY